MKKVIVVLALFVAINASAQWVQTEGIYGGEVTSFALLGSKIFAGTRNNGVVVSTNGGNNWLPSSFNNMYIQSLCTKSNAIYAMPFYEIIYRSTDEGINWTTISVCKDYLKKLGTAGNNLLAGTYDSGIYVSTNNGSNWIHSNLNSNEVYDFAAYGNQILAATGKGFFISSDSGLNWSLFGPNNVGINSIAVNGNNIYAGSYYAMFVSSDGGNSWRKDSVPFRQIYSIYVKDNILLAGVDYGVYSSTNNGANWSFYEFKSTPRAFTEYGNSILAAAFGIYKTTNNGVNWTETAINNCEIMSLTTDGNNVYAGTIGKGAFLTTNNGLSWSHAGLEDMYYVWSLGICGNYLFAGTWAQGMYLSTNKGANWAFCGLDSIEIRRIAVNGNNVYASTGSSLFLSTNYGASWTLKHKYPPYFNSLAFSGKNIYAAGEHINVSSDGGNSWTEIGIGNDYNDVYSIATNGNYIYAGTQRGVYVTTNNGKRWTQTALKTGSIGNIIVYGNYLFACTSSFNYLKCGMYVSSNNGTTWTEKSEGISSLFSITGMTVTNDYLLIGTSSNSVWRRPLSEITQNLTEDIKPGYVLMQNYPNPFNNKTKIKFEIGKQEFVKVVIYNVMGREVQTLMNETLSPGNYEVPFSASGLSSGVYFYMIVTDGFTETKRMVLIK